MIPALHFDAPIGQCVSLTSSTLISYCIEAVAIDVANMVVSGNYQHLEEGVVVGAGALVHA